MPLLCPVSLQRDVKGLACHLNASLHIVYSNSGVGNQVNSFLNRFSANLLPAWTILGDSPGNGIDGIMLTAVRFSASRNF